ADRRPQGVRVDRVGGREPVGALDSDGGAGGRGDGAVLDGHDGALAVGALKGELTVLELPQTGCTPQQRLEPALVQATQATETPRSAVAGDHPLDILRLPR